METALRQSEQEFLESQVESGSYQSVSAALSEAIGLLRRRDELRSLIAERYQQIERGEFTDFDEGGLRAFFEELKHGELDSL